MTALVRTPTGRGLRRAAALLVVLLVVSVGALWWLAGATRTHVTAYFDKAVGLYAGSAVRVLGVQVGEVDAVHPDGPLVRTELSIDRSVRIPDGALAVVVSPSLVSDRYVQLTPAYSGGPSMSSGAVIPRERTATPVELDDLYRSANRLSAALGPEGANKNGALSNLLNTGAANLRGNGQKLNDTIKQLSDAANTLQGSRGDLFTTVDNLNKFTGALAASDDQIHQFDARFADVNGFLAQDSQQMGAALNSLSTSLNDVNGFVEDNRGLLQSNVDKLTGVSKALVDQRQSIAEVLDVAPLAASNFINTYDAASGSTAVRLDLAEFSYPPTMMVCLLLKHSTPRALPPAVSDTCRKLAPLVDGALHLPTTDQALDSLQRGQLPPLPLPLIDSMNQQKAGENAGRAAGGGPR
jgi:virulence factor Mce-like protein